MRVRNGSRRDHSLSSNGDVLKDIIQNLAKISFGILNDLGECSRSMAQFYKRHAIECWSTMNHSYPSHWIQSHCNLRIPLGHSLTPTNIESGQTNIGSLTSSGNWAGPGPKLIFRTCCPLVWLLFVIVDFSSKENLASIGCCTMNDVTTLNTLFAS